MGLLCEDISCCDRTKNAPVQVFNKAGNEMPPEFTYTTEMIFRFDVEPSTSNEEEVPCTCRDYYNDDGTVKVSYETIIRECTDPACRFRFLSGGLKTKLQIYYQERKKFWGVRTLESIPEGRFITEYIGEMHNSDLDEIEDDYIFYTKDSEPDNIFPLDSNGNSKSWHINAHRFGNVARFFNHSCDANISSYFVRVGNEPFLRIGFYSCREILGHEELTINYGHFWWEMKGDKIKCKCGNKEYCIWS